MKTEQQPQKEVKKNLQLPGNPRYQPKELVDIFGYDNLYRQAIKVEFSAMKALYQLGFIPEKDFRSLTPELMKKIEEEITTTMVDKVERKITKHDIRALVKLIQERLPENLRRFVHVPLTSYDVLDTARVLQFREAFEKSLKPSILKVMHTLTVSIIVQKDTIQIGRTHGQHALPITVGFWLATVLNRLFKNYKRLEQASKKLPGKISGAVGAYNAQENFQMKNFESLVLQNLKLKPAPISTQILPPEYLADYLHSCILVSATLGQFGLDCQNLMRTEIAEVAEAFDNNQVGSSTMAHKRNPINFENLEGTWKKNKIEYFKVLETLTSTHQRDLVGSSIMRDFPTIVVNLQSQLNTLNREKDGITFLGRLIFDKENIGKNLRLSAKYVIAEPIYLTLQLYGYQKDAHQLVNHCLMPKSKECGNSLFEQLKIEAETDKELAEILYNKIPTEVLKSLESPEEYTGRAVEKSLEISEKVLQFLEEI